MEKGQYVHYGCGLTAPLEWDNYDTSPTLRIQKAPVVGKILSSKLNIRFPGNVKYGDIVSGLPVGSDSCDGIYCSHVLEHLALRDFKVAIKNTYKILKPNGVFRCVVPDLEAYARNYLHSLDQRDSNSSLKFLKDSLLGYQERARGFKGLMVNLYGNSKHLWMWDYLSLSSELAQVGFKDIRRCQFNDCEDAMFKLVENAGRFKDAVAVECRK